MENFMNAAAAEPRLIPVTIFMGLFLAAVLFTACAMAWEEISESRRSLRSRRSRRY